MSKRKRRNKNWKLYLQIFISFVAMVYLYMRVSHTNVDSSKITKVFIILILAVLVFFLIKVLYKWMLKNKTSSQYLSSNIQIVDRMTGEEFEEFLKAHFEKLGYKVDTTPKSNDYGADLVMDKDGYRTVVQAKGWVNKVGIEAVQQIIGAKAYYKANKCIVITNNYFTPNAVNLAASNKEVDLWDRKVLIKMMERNNTAINNIGEINKRVICSKCGAEMILKHGKYGDFYSCSNYPRCKCTKTI